MPESNTSNASDRTPDKSGGESSASGSPEQPRKPQLSLRKKSPSEENPAEDPKAEEPEKPAEKPAAPETPAAKPKMSLRPRVEPPTPEETPAASEEKLTEEPAAPETPDAPEEKPAEEETPPAAKPAMKLSVSRPKEEKPEDPPAQDPPPPLAPPPLDKEPEPTPSVETVKPVETTEGKPVTEKAEDGEAGPKEPSKLVPALKAVAGILMIGALVTGSIWFALNFFGSSQEESSSPQEAADATAPVAQEESQAEEIATEDPPPVEADTPPPTPTAKKTTPKDPAVLAWIKSAKISVKKTADGKFLAVVDGKLYARGAVVNSELNVKFRGIHKGTHLVFQDANGKNYPIKFR